MTVVPNAGSLPGDAFTTRRFGTRSGVAIAYDQWRGPAAGSPLVVFLHATGFTRGVWRPHCARLTAGQAELSAFAVDLRGHGASDKPPPPYDWRAFIQDTIELLDHQPTREIVLCGHSVGGATAIEVAAERPDLVRGLVLLEAAVTPRKQGMDAGGSSSLIDRTIRRRSAWASRDEAAAYIRLRSPYDAWDREVFAGFIDAGIADSSGGGVELACPPEIEASVFREAVGSRAWDRLGEVQCPAWVGRGTGTRGMPSTTSPEAAGRMRQATESLADGCGHFAPLEDVGWVVGLVAEALATSITAGRA